MSLYQPSTLNSPRGVVDPAHPAPPQPTIPIISCTFRKKWMHSHKMNLILSPDTYLPIHVLQPSATTGRFGALSSRFAFTKVMDFLRSWSSFIMVEHHTFVKFLPKAENPSHFCLVCVVQRPPTVVLHVGCLEGMPHQLLLEVGWPPRGSHVCCTNMHCLLIACTHT